MIMKCGWAGGAGFLLLSTAALGQPDQTAAPTGSVRSSEVPTRGMSINRLPDDEQCKQLITRAAAVPALRRSRDYLYCVKRQRPGG